MSIEPLEVVNGSISTVAFKINWAALSKEELLNGLWHQIEQLWQTRNPEGKTGRPPSLRPFFDGLVIRRRLDRGVGEYDACQGTAYTAHKDGRQRALNAGGMRALNLADGKLAETLETLQKIEQRTAGTEVR